MDVEEAERDNVVALQEWLAAHPGHAHRVEDRAYLGWVHVVRTSAGVVVARDADLGVVVDALLARGGKLG